MLTLIAAIFVFLFVILFHEFGHFIVAKSVGVRVNEFSIGMGPKLLQKKKGETEYTIRVLPIGGYVSMEGEDEDSDDPRGFANVSPLAKIAVMVAGAVMNFVLAIIVFTIVSFTVGSQTTTIDETIPGSPAEKAGLNPGEVIVSINDSEIKEWNDIVTKIGDEEIGKDIKIVVDSSGEEKIVNLKTEKAEDGRAIIGIKPTMERGFIKSIKTGVLQTGLIIKSMFNVFGMLFRGELGSESFSGPVGVIKTIGQEAKNGFINVLALMGFISVNLGFFNLLPIPALDGGRIIFVLLEMLRGKPMDPEKEGTIHLIGFAILIFLMLFVTYTDVSKLNLFKR